MSILGKAQLVAVAIEVRSAEAQMSALVANLTARANWTGADRDAFEREWNDLVRTRLLSAAQKVESVAFIPLG